MQTNRRSFLTRSSLGLAALASPAWINTAFSAPQDATDQSRSITLLTAWKRAKAGGRPLLIFVVPKERSQGYNSARAWGQFLNHGAPEHLAMLPLAELTCASLEDIKTALGPELKAAGQSLPLLEPSALLIESSTLAINVVAPAPEDLGRLSIEGTYGTRKKLSAKRIEARITSTGESLRKLLWPDDETLARRLHEERSALRIDTEDLTDAALVHLAPAALLVRVRKNPERLQLALGQLAARTAKQMQDPIDGTRWGNSSGCGYSVEGRPQTGLRIACGMGMIDHHSGRFLMLYALSGQF